MKILVRLPNWLGDGVMATPFLQTLQAHFPNAQLILVAPASVCALLEREGGYSLVVDHTKSAKNRLLATYKLAKSLAPCDLAFALTNNFYSALLLYWSGAPIRIGYAKNLRSFLLTHALQFQNTHQVLSYYNLLSPLIDPLPDAPPLKLSAKPFDLQTTRKTIGLSPGAAFGSSKRWEAAYFTQVARHFLEQGHAIYFLGAPSDQELIQEIIQPLGTHPNLYNLCGQTTLHALIDTIASLDLFIANDSGPMHMASALQTPLIALFGPTIPLVGKPWKHPKARSLFKNLPCSPCKKRTCPIKSGGSIEPHACMVRITPQEVINMANALL
ncbi:lipopolysaccharide heptosyltransferase II [Helicobacter bizzozeronii]|uniref:lipopolysaccharide heptosyltransferase II n=1 Tax=Helicobacter bizzozeronii TaxID=56877 RepID=UPI000CF112C5|nr:lipopolysaccharide heptosyltransferase II [Helicobacter bizzozeronii]